MEDVVLVVGGAVEGAGLVVTTGGQAGDRLEAVPVGEAGQGLLAALGHHAHQVRGGRACRGSETQKLYVIICSFLSESPTETCETQESRQ